MNSNMRPDQEDNYPDELEPIEDYERNTKRNEAGNKAGQTTVSGIHDAGE